MEGRRGQRLYHLEHQELSSHRVLAPDERVELRQTCIEVSEREKGREGGREGGRKRERGGEGGCMMVKENREKETCTRRGVLNTRGKGGLGRAPNLDMLVDQGKDVGCRV